MRKREYFFVALAVLLTLNLIFVVAQTGFTSFDVGSLLFKVSVNQGESVTKTITIKPSGFGDFSVDVISVPGVSVDNEKFVLFKGDSRDIKLMFNSSELEPGVYVGNLEIRGGDNIKKIPVIFEVESKDVFFDANIDIPPAYTEIKPGTKIVAQVKIFDLVSGGGLQEGVGAVPVDLIYTVSGIDGDIISSEEERVIVEKRAQFSKTINFPDDIARGNYVLSVIVDYKSSRGVSSQSFSVSGGEIEDVQLSPLDFKLGNISGVNLIALGIFAFVLVLFLGVIFLFVYVVKDRDKMLFELRKLNSHELLMQKEMLQAQTRILRQRKAVTKIVRVEVKEKVKKLKKKQTSRVKEMKKLKKTGNDKEMKKKLEGWKKQGYNTLPLDYKLEGLTTNEMKGLLKRWKNKYTAKYKKKK